MPLSLGRPVKLRMRDRIIIYREKIFHSGGSNEPEEFLEAYAKLQRLRKQLRVVLKGVKMWLNSSKSLAKSARFLAQAVETERETFFQLTADLDQELENQTTLDAIAKKIIMLDELAKDRKTLVGLRHLRNYYERRANVVSGKDIDEETKIEYREKANTAKIRYDEHYAQLLVALHFVVDEADQNGHCSLISPELSAFKLSQFQFFLNAQKIIQGSQMEDASDLNDEWNKFAGGLTNQRQRARSHARRQNNVMNTSTRGGNKGSITTSLSQIAIQTDLEEGHDDDHDADSKDTKTKERTTSNADSDSDDDETPSSSEGVPTPEELGHMSPTHIHAL